MKIQPSTLPSQLSNSISFAHAARPSTICFSLVLLATAFTLHAAIADAWVQTHTNGRTRGLALDSAGNVIVTGEELNGSGNLDVYIAKYAAISGAILWEQRFASPGGADDIPAGLVADQRGDVVVAWSSRAHGAGFNTGSNMTAKYRGSDGALLWQRKNSNWVSTVTLDGNGDVLVGGSNFDAKYSGTNGTVVWQHSRPFSTIVSTLSIKADARGDVVVNSFNGFVYHFAKYAGTNGATRWATDPPNFPIPALRPLGSRNMAFDQDGNVLIYRDDATNAGPITYTAKYAGTNGALLWGIIHTNQISALAVDRQGDAIVVGSFDADPSVGYIAKLSGTNGAYLWVSAYHGSEFFGEDLFDSDEFINEVAIDCLGDVFVSGNSGGYSENEDILRGLLSAKFSRTNGILLWEKRFRRLSDSSNGGVIGYEEHLALGSNGTVVAASSILQGDPATAALLTVVYAPQLPPLSVTPVPSGLRIQFTGIAGRTYEIQRSAELPGTWETFLTTNAPAEGRIDVTNAVLGMVGFFRIATAP